MANEIESAARRAAFGQGGFNGDDFDGRPDILATWQAAVRAVLHHWLEHDFRIACRDGDMLNELALLKVGVEKGDEPAEVIRRVVAGFVKDQIERTIAARNR